MMLGNFQPNQTPKRVQLLNVIKKELREFKIEKVKDVFEVHTRLSVSPRVRELITQKACEIYGSSKRVEFYSENAFMVINGGKSFYEI